MFSHTILILKLIFIFLKMYPCIKKSQFSELVFRSLMSCARKFEFSIFSLIKKTGFKRSEGALSANWVQNNFLTKNICIFGKIDVNYDKKDHNDGILWYLKEVNPKKPIFIVFLAVGEGEGARGLKPMRKFFFDASKHAIISFAKWL